MYHRFISLDASGAYSRLRLVLIGLCDNVLLTV